jgi:signal peptidase I
MSPVAMKRRLSTAGRVGRDLLLTIGALLGLCCIVLAVASTFFGVQPLIFRSGSMAPAIDTGAFALAHDVGARDLEADDIVSVHTAAGTRVTHRIADISQTPGGARLLLKGDANDAEDPAAYDVTSADRVFVSVPKLGYVVTWFAGPWGVFLLGMYAAFVVYVIVRGVGRSTPRGPGPGGGARRATSALVLGLVVAASSTTLTGRDVPTLAAWTDDVAVSGTTLTASVVPAPATFTCGLLGLASTTFNWSAVSGATNYTLFFNSGTSSTTVTGTSSTITGGSGGPKTAWVRANHVYTGVTWSSVNSNTRTYNNILGLLSTCS